ncbi:TolC family outer membrane protein [Catenovulum sp. 2E275]|uniref:TolC family outer membrane protein n=1 Tax=Catenovulum sp. 2E275 TaxID=2980497 RepID=UPI0021D1EEC5|nr:TolC family outer membrane protein [Catenovulum sp. 2E275]MCU4676839.1 TolC family outer membrane protein [Catenovulum sp. 2E275]
MISFSKHQTNHLFKITSWMTFFFASQGITAQPQLNDLTTQVQIAIDNNPQVQEKWHAFQSSIQGTEIAESGFLPSVDLTASLGYQKQNYGNSDSFSTKSAGVSLTQMLYDGFETSNNIARFENVQLVRYFELIEQTNTTAFEAANAYLDVLKYKQLVAIAQENLNTHEAVYDQIKQGVDAGIARAADLEQITGRLSLAQTNILTEESNLHDVIARYIRVVGQLPPNQPKQFSISGSKIPNKIQSALHNAYLNNPKFYATLYNIQAQESLAQMSKSGYHPKINLTARYGIEDRDEFGFEEDRTEGRIAIELSYNLFRGGADKASVKQAYQEVNLAKDLRDQACREIRQNVQIAYNEIRIISTQLPALEQHKNASEKVKKAYKDQFDIGQRTLLDVLDSENEYFQSSRAYLNAGYDKLASELKILTEMGQILTALAVTQNELPSVNQLTNTPIKFDPGSACPAYDINQTIKSYYQQPKAIAITEDKDSDMDGIKDSIDLCPNTPKDEQVNSKGCTQFKNETVSVDIKIPFSSNSATIKQQYYLEIKKLADFMEKYPETVVEIQGHSSLDGDAIYNKQLSEQRAFAVAQVLTTRYGINPTRVRAVGYGIESPKIAEISSRANAINRRIEAQVSTQFKQALKK